MPQRVLLLALFLAAGSPVLAADKPNIVFILCDDLGINDLHCYGRQDHHTPNLDRLAEQGARFTSAYCAQPICSPSRAAILTGKTPARLHLTTFLPGRPDCVSQKVLHPEIEMQVPLSEKMLPRYFKEAGYVTAAIGKWHVGGSGFGPLDHGFDVYHAGRPNTKPSATEGGKGEYDLTAFAERFIETNKDRPFVVYLAHNAPHIPYDAQPARIANNSKAFEPVYAGVIETIDDTVGRVLAKLDALGLADKTIVVFTSDNGGLHVPEGPHPKVTHNTPYRAGKGFVYEGGLRIPLIVRWPGHVGRGQVVEAPVINTDWLPTLLELAGLPVPAGLDGVSFAGVLTGRGAAPARSLFWHFPHYTNQGSRPSGAMRDGNWMMVEYYDEEAAELFDLAADVRETHDLAAQHPDRVATMRAALVAWRKDVNAQTNRPNPNFDPAKYRALYRDVDASRFDPAQADRAEWEKIWAWRKGMDAVVPRSEKVKPRLTTAVSRAGPRSHEAVEAVWNSEDRFIRETVLPNIEKHRKSDFTLRLVDARGRPLPNLAISGSLKRHQFLFGACPPEKQEDFDPRFVAAWSDVFGYGVAQNALKWANVERRPGEYDVARIDRMLDLCMQHDVVLEYHFLSGYHPQWLAALPDAEKASRQKAFAREMLRRYQDKIAFFQVYNEDWLTHVARAKVYFDQTEFFAELTREFPRVKFGVSDCWSLDASSPLPDPDVLKKRYPGISYLALHGHKPRSLWASPEEMYRNFDKYLGSGITLHITEFGIDGGAIQGSYRQGTWNDQNTAEYFVQVRAVAFSHPAVEAFNHWDMGPGIRSRKGNALVSADFSPKLAYAAIKSLIKDKLTTTIDAARSDPQGECRFRGFHGRYEITITNEAGHRVSAALVLDAKNPRGDLVVQDAGGPNMSVRVKQERPSASD